MGGMLEEIVGGALALVGAYLAAGVLFAVPFVLRWVRRIDPDAEGGSRGFRALIFPGAVALWPVLLWRVRQGSGALPVERSAHRDARGGAR